MPTNRNPSEIYQDYRHELDRMWSIVREAPEQFADDESFESLAATLEKLEALVELYAVLLARR